MTTEALEETNSWLHILTDDLHLFTEGFRQVHPNDAIVYSNRFSADVLLFFSERKTIVDGLYFIGAALRNIAEQFMLRSNFSKFSKEELRTLSDAVADFSADTATLLPSIESSLSEFIDKYHNVMDKMVMLRQSEDEKKHYTRKDGATTFFRRHLIRLLSNVEIQLFSEEVYVGIDGIISEYDRIMRSYGFSKLDILYFTALKSHSWLDNYYKSLLAYSSRGGLHSDFRNTISGERVKDIQDFMSFASGFDTKTGKVQLDFTTEYVSKTMHKWRSFFIVFMDIGPKIQPLVQESEKETKAKAGRRRTEQDG